MEFKYLQVLLNVVALPTPPPLPAQNPRETRDDGISNLAFSCEANTTASQERGNVTQPQCSPMRSQGEAQGSRWGSHQVKCPF